MKYSFKTLGQRLLIGAGVAVPIMLADTNAWKSALVAGLAAAFGVDLHAFAQAKTDVPKLDAPK